jgi:hypothetical protein
MAFMRSWGRSGARFGVVCALLAAFLVPDLVAPMRAISIPRTLMRMERRVPSGIERVTPQFPPTHIAFTWTGQKGTGVRYRVIDEFGIATHWRRVAESHDMGFGDHHFSGVQSVDRPASIEWYPVHPRGREMGAVTLDYMNTEDGPRVTRLVPVTAEARANVPHIVTRDEWNADESMRKDQHCSPNFYRVQQLFVHHTAGSNSNSDPAATMRAIYSYHVKSRGWCDIGYNFVIARNGVIFEGRWARDYKPWETHDSENQEGKAVVGAHVEGFNSGSVGISLIGNYQSAKLPAAARGSLVKMLAWEADRHNLKAEGTHTYKNPDSGRKKVLPFIAGHRDAGQTDCPGTTVYRDLKNIRADVKAKIDAGKSNVSLSLDPPEQTIRYGDETTITGTLTTRAGEPLAAQIVGIHTQTPGTRWRDAADALTDENGFFSFTTQPVRTLKVGSQYEGDTDNWPSESVFATVGVRPIVTLEPRRAGTVGASGVVHYPAGTTTIPVRGTVTPRHAGKPIVVRVQKVKPDGTRTLLEKLKTTLTSEGTYEATFRGAKDGHEYRLVSWFLPDRDHEFASGGPLKVAIDS